MSTVTSVQEGEADVSAAIMEQEAPLPTKTETTTIFIQGSLDTKQCYKDSVQAQRSQYYELSGAALAPLTQEDTGHRAAKEHAQGHILEVGSNALNQQGTCMSKC